MTDNSQNYFHYWGKSRPRVDNAHRQSYHLLVYHSLDVAAVGQQILKLDPALRQKIIPSYFFSNDTESETWINGVITFLLALHDIGKFSDRFQNLIPDLLKELKGYTYNRNPI